MLLEDLYGAVAGARNFLYDRRILAVRKLSWPVVSVGNLSTGGSGKTPFVIMLGKLLVDRGISIDVLSRGYRRSTRGVLKVNREGTPQQFGDEPLLIARKLGCPVFVGEERYLAGKVAEQTGSAASRRMHLLDDGFQHRRLHREFDIVLLNREDLDDKLLPAGRLREPLSSVRRADAIVIDEEFPRTDIPQGAFQICRVRRRIDAPPLDCPVVAFCGIARPQRFFLALRNRGIDVREEISFLDHHRYSMRDARLLASKQSQIPGSRLLTTEKDAINLGEHLGSLNPIVVPIKMELVDPDAALYYMLDRIAERSR